MNKEKLGNYSAMSDMNGVDKDIHHLPHRGDSMFKGCRKE